MHPDSSTPGIEPVQWHILSSAVGCMPLISMFMRKFPHLRNVGFEEKSAIDPNCRGARCFATALTPPAISMLQVLTRGEEICRNTAQLHINPKLVHRQRQQHMYIAGTAILLHRVTAVMPDTGQRAKIKQLYRPNWSRARATRSMAFPLVAAPASGTPAAAPAMTWPLR